MRSPFAPTAPLRILWVLKELGIGGAERLLLELMPHMPTVEFLPVAVTAGPLDLVPEFQAAGLAPVSLGASGNLDARWPGRLRALARAERPDVVHLHLPYTAVGGRIALRGLGLPIVYTEHNVWEAIHPVTRWANALTIGMDDAVIAVSDRVRSSILSSRLGRRTRGRIHVIRNGIDTERVRSDAEPEPGVSVPIDSYGAITTFSPRKGVDVLIDASAIVQREFPHRRCLIVGGGPLDEALRRRAMQVGARSVDFIGQRKDARSILARMGLVVIPSRYEGLPLLVLEAMALGRPIVATTAGGLPEVLEHGRTALLVPPDDPEALAAAIAEIFRDPPLAASLGASARAEVEARWHVRGTAERLLRVYEDGSGR